MKTITSVIGAALVLLALPLSVFAATASVSIGDNYFSPQNVTINAGDTVAWTNLGHVVHSVLSDTNLFNSSSLQPQATFSAVFNAPGTYPYYDQTYGRPGGVNMAGTITVNPSAGSVIPSSGSVIPSNTATVNGLTASQIAAQAQALIAQVQALRAQIAQAGGSTSISSGSVSGSSCPSFGRVLGLGSSGNDVAQLQQFLSRDPSVYPQALVTGYFGPATQAAVQAWQTKYNIVSSGSPSTSGFGLVGPRTASAMIQVCGGGTVNFTNTSSGTSVSTTNPNIVSGFIQVSPIAGNAPLSVSVTATVNTANSCSGGTYLLDFGDGSTPQQLIVQPGNCSQAAQTFTHIYQAPGTFQIVLSAGSHQSTATVTVYGTGGGGTTSNSTQPTGSINAFTTSGTAPFSATFYISCASGVAYDVVFGDGQDLGGNGVSQSACNGGLQSVQHTYNTPGTYSAQLQVFTQNSNGIVTPQGLGSVQINVTSASGSTSTGGSTSSGYPPMTVTPNVGGNPLAVSVQFDLTGCPPYSLSWGDSTTGVSGTAGSCSSTTGSYSHTYAQNGTYVITLVRGSQQDTVSVTISS